VHPESSDDKSNNRRRRRRSVYGMWIPVRENVPGVNVDNAHVVCCSVCLPAAAEVRLGME